MKWINFAFVLVYCSVLFGQQIDTVHVKSTGSIYLGMGYDELTPYTSESPGNGKAKWCTLKSGFETNFVGFTVNEVKVLCENGVVRKIQMKTNKLYPHTENEKLLVRAFGKLELKEGNDEIYRIHWHIGQYVVDFNGGRDLRENYIYLIYAEDYE